MKFLISSTPRASTSNLPGDHDTMHQAEAFIEGMLRDGKLDCSYQRVTGGGIGIANSNSAEELWELINNYPLSAWFDWQVEPLADIRAIFAKTLEK
jgi:hypothetical protein